MKNLLLLLLVATLSANASDPTETQYPRGLTREEYEQELYEMLQEQSDEEREEQEERDERLSELVEQECDKQEELEAYYTVSQKDERKGDQSDNAYSNNQFDPALKSHLPRHHNTEK